MLHSEKMLQIVKTAWQMFESVEDDTQVEVLWLAAITGLRAIGHILDKTDKQNHPELANAIETWWSSLKENKGAKCNRIFFTFINDERNETIKELKINYDKQPQNIAIVRQSNSQSTESIYELDGLLYIPMIDGPYAGEDVRDMIAEAIKWWELQFQVIKNSDTV